MPHVAATVRRPARPPRRRGPPRRRPARRRRRGAPSAATASATSPGRPRSPTTRPTVDVARWLIHEAAQALGARSREHPRAVHGARPRRGRRASPCPAINIRAQTFDMARTVYETAAADGRRRGDPRARPERADLHVPAPDRLLDRGPRRARSRPAGSGPVFIQGDHYQFNAKKYADDPEAMTEEIRRACRLAIEAGYRNIDIDCSTLVDLSKPTVDEQQRENYVRAAELTALIRSLETDGVTISVGGEIGEVGKKNSTEEELRAYLDGYRRELDAPRAGRAGISKVSVQTGTSHGGVPLPDGGVAEVKLDFDVLRRLGEVAREYGLAGRRPARRVDPARRAVPPVPGGRDGRDPPRDRASRTRSTSTRRSRPSSIEPIEHWCFAQRRRRAQGRPDRPAVRLHDAEEGDRAVQARAVGPADEGRDPRGPAPQDRVPVHGARRERVAGDGRAATSTRSRSHRPCPTRCASRRPPADDGADRDGRGAQTQPTSGRQIDRCRRGFRRRRRRSAALAPGVGSAVGAGVGFGFASVVGVGVGAAVARWRSGRRGCWRGSRPWRRRGARSAPGRLDGRDRPAGDRVGWLLGLAWCRERRARLTSEPVATAADRPGCVAARTGAAPGRSRRWRRSRWNGRGSGRSRRSGRRRSRPRRVEPSDAGAAGAVGGRHDHSDAPSRRIRTTAAIAADRIEPIGRR